MYTSSYLFYSESPSKEWSKDCVLGIAELIQLKVLIRVLSVSEVAELSKGSQLSQLEP